MLDQSPTNLADGLTFRPLNLRFSLRINGTLDGSAAVVIAAGLGVAAAGAEELAAPDVGVEPTAAPWTGELVLTSEEVALGAGVALLAVGVASPDVGVAVSAMGVVASAIGGAESETGVAVAGVGGVAFPCVGVIPAGAAELPVVGATGLSTGGITGLAPARADVVPPPGVGVVEPGIGGVTAPETGGLTPAATGESADGVELVGSTGFAAVETGVLAPVGTGGAEAVVYVGMTIVGIVVAARFAMGVAVNGDSGPNCFNCRSSGEMYNFDKEVPI